MIEVTNPIVFVRRYSYAIRYIGGVLFLSVLTAAGSYPQQMAIVSRPNASLHGTPVSTGKVMATLDLGTRVEVLTAQGIWRLVQSQDYVGWIHNGALKGDELVPSTTTFEPAPLKMESSTPPPSNVPARSPASSRSYYRGPRGGCYYINSNGNKTYVDRSLCN